jgi:glycerate dehydrogenase
MTQRIVFLDRDTIAPYINVRRPDFDHEWVEFDRTKADQVLDHMSGATIAIVNKVQLRGDDLAKCPDLKMISVAATGTDNIDLEYCRANGIIVSHIRGYALHTVPEHAFALILALRRSIIGYRQDVAAGEWQKAAQFCFFNHPMDDLHASRLGIVGEGAIGQAVASIGQGGFGMETVFMDHDMVSGEARSAGTFVSFDELLETSDVITLHCPLLPSTRDLFGIEQFRQMKETALIVNTARGGLIQDNALAQAIEEGLIGGAGIDVLAPEPPADDHPYFKLLERPNFILTPHVAWASREAMQFLSDQMIDHIENFERGEPSNVVGEF